MLSKAAQVIVQAQGSADITAKRLQAKAGVPFAKQVLPVSTTATPKHVHLNMAGGWKKQIPMTDLTPAMCSSTNKTRDTKEDRHMVARDGAIVWTETEQADMSGDKRMGAADLLLAADNLVKAVREFYVPREQADILAGNLVIHFAALKARPEFAKPDLFPRIAAYNTEILGAFVSAAPDDQFDVSGWQLEVWLYVGESARNDMVKSSFRAGGAAAQNQQLQQRALPQQPQQQQFQRGVAGSGGGGGAGAGAPRPRLRGYACGSRTHVFKDCDGTPTWLTKRAGQRFFEAPNNIRPCWNANSVGCPNPAKQSVRPCNYSHCCTLCGTGSGLPGSAAAGHSAQSCT
jgi:hypothetical protein